MSHLFSGRNAPRPNEIKRLDFIRPVRIAGGNITGVNEMSSTTLSAGPIRINAAGDVTGVRNFAVSGLLSTQSTIELSEVSTQGKLEAAGPLILLSPGAYDFSSIGGSDTDYGSNTPYYTLKFPSRLPAAGPTQRAMIWSVADNSQTHLSIIQGSRTHRFVVPTGEYSGPELVTAIMAQNVLGVIQLTYDAPTDRFQISVNDTNGLANDPDNYTLEFVLDNTSRLAVLMGFIARGTITVPTTTIQSTNRVITSIHPTAFASSAGSSQGFYGGGRRKVVGINAWSPVSQTWVGSADAQSATVEFMKTNSDTRVAAGLTNVSVTVDALTAASLLVGRATMTLPKFNVTQDGTGVVQTATTSADREVLAPLFDISNAGNVVLSTSDSLLSKMDTDGAFHVGPRAGGASLVLRSRDLKQNLCGPSLAFEGSSSNLTAVNSTMAAIKSIPAPFTSTLTSTTPGGQLVFYTNTASTSTTNNPREAFRVNEQQTVQIGVSSTTVDVRGTLLSPKLHVDGTTLLTGATHMRGGLLISSGNLTSVPNSNTLRVDGTTTSQSFVGTSATFTSLTSTSVNFNTGTGTSLSLANMTVTGTLSGPTIDYLTNAVNSLSGGVGVVQSSTVLIQGGSTGDMLLVGDASAMSSTNLVRFASGALNITGNLVASGTISSPTITTLQNQINSINSSVAGTQGSVLVVGATNNIISMSNATFSIGGLALTGNFSATGPISSPTITALQNSISSINSAITYTGNAGNVFVMGPSFAPVTVSTASFTSGGLTMTGFVNASGTITSPTITNLQSQIDAITGSTGISGTTGDVLVRGSTGVASSATNASLTSAGLTIAGFVNASGSLSSPTITALQNSVTTLNGLVNFVGNPQGTAIVVGPSGAPTAYTNATFTSLGMSLTGSLNVTGSIASPTITTLQSSVTALTNSLTFTSGQGSVMMVGTSWNITTAPNMTLTSGGASITGTLAVSGAISGPTITSIQNSIQQLSGGQLGVSGDTGAALALGSSSNLQPINSVLITDGGINIKNVTQTGLGAIQNLVVPLTSNESLGYTVTSSSDQNPPFLAFDGSSDTSSTTNDWLTQTGLYVSSDYVGSVTTSDANNQTYAGEWIQVRVLRPSTITSVFIGANDGNSIPRAFWLLGSNTGVDGSWSLLATMTYRGSFAGIGYTQTVSPSAANTTSIYFRLVVSNVFSTSFARIGTLILYGRPINQLDATMTSTNIRSSNLLTIDSPFTRCTGKLFVGNLDVTNTLRPISLDEKRSTAFVPFMLSNTQGGFTTSASSNTTDAWKAFSSSESWSSAASTYNSSGIPVSTASHVQIALDTPRTVEQVTIQSSNVQTFEVHVSEDGTTWQSLGSSTSLVVISSNPTYLWSFVRVVITRLTNASGSAIVQQTTIQGGSPSTHILSSNLVSRDQVSAYRLRAYRPERARNLDIIQTPTNARVEYGDDLVFAPSGNDAVIMKQDGTLQVNGPATIGTTLNVSGDSTLADLTAGPSTLASTSITNNATVGGTLGVTGAATLSSTLTAGASTLSSASVTNNATVGGTLVVTGATTLADLSADTSTLDSTSITNDASIGGTLDVTGATTLASTLSAGTSTLASASITNNATVGGTLGVTGVTTLAGLSAGTSTLASASITNNTTVGGTLGVTGVTTLAGLSAGTSTLASATVTNNATIGGTLGVTGATTLSSTLRVTGRCDLTYIDAGNHIETGAGGGNSWIDLHSRNSSNVDYDVRLLSTSGTIGTAGVGAFSILAGATSIQCPLTVTGSSTLASATMSGTLGVTGAATLSSTLSAGASTFASASVTGNTTVGGTLGVTGLSTLASATVTNNATVGGTLGVTGTATLASTLSAGASTLASATVTNNATIGGTLGVTGATTLASTLSAGASTLASATVTNNATIGGTLGVTGRTSTSGIGISTSAAAATPLTGAIVVQNTGTTGSSHATALLQTSGASGGSPYFSMDVAAVTGWSVGIDNADSQKFKIRSAFNFTGTSVMTLESNNNASFAGRMFQSTSHQIPMMVFGSQIVTSQNNSFFGVTITVNIPFTPTSNNIVVTVCNGDRGANTDFTPLSALWDTTSTVWVTCRGTNGFAARINWCAQFLY